MSPEGLLHNTYSEKTDIWAFGVFIYELLHGVSPFLDCKTEQDLRSATCRPIPEHKFRANISPPLRQLMASLLTIDENSRPSMFDLQKNPYIRSILSQRRPSPGRTRPNGLNMVQPFKTHNSSKSTTNGNPWNEDKPRKVESQQITPRKMI